MKKTLALSKDRQIAAAKAKVKITVQGMTMYDDKIDCVKEVRGKPGPSKKAKSEYTLQKIDDVKTGLL